MSARAFTISEVWYEIVLYVHIKKIYIIKIIHINILCFVHIDWYICINVYFVTKNMTDNIVIQINLVI